MLDFQEKFDTVFFDPEFGFKADDKLVTLIIASLSYEYCDWSNKNPTSIIPHDVISPGIYFVYQGKVDMYYKDNEEPLLWFEQGCYFGDISYIFSARNQFYYFLQPLQQDHVHDKIFDYFKMYSLQDNAL